MTKTFRLEGLDCPVCASKVERAVKALDGVKSASVSFLTAKLTIEYAGSAPENFDKTLKSAIRKANPDVSVKGG